MRIVDADGAVTGRGPHGSAADTIARALAKIPSITEAEALRMVSRYERELRGVRFTDLHPRQFADLQAGLPVARGVASPCWTVRRADDFGRIESMGGLPALALL